MLSRCVSEGTSPVTGKPKEVCRYITFRKYLGEGGLNWGRGHKSAVREKGDSYTGETPVVACFIDVSDQ